MIKQLLKNVIAVIPPVIETQTHGGIHLPEERFDYMQHRACVIRYVGSKVVEPELKPGVVVLCPNHLGNRVCIQGEDLIMYDVEDVKGIVEFSEGKSVEKQG